MSDNSKIDPKAAKSGSEGSDVQSGRARPLYPPKPGDTPPHSGAAPVKPTSGNPNPKGSGGASTQSSMAGSAGDTKNILPAGDEKPSATTNSSDKPALPPFRNTAPADKPTSKGEISSRARKGTPIEPEPPKLEKMKPEDFELLAEVTVDIFEKALPPEIDEITIKQGKFDPKTKDQMLRAYKNVYTAWVPEADPKWSTLIIAALVTTKSVALKWVDFFMKPKPKPKSKELPSNDGNNKSEAQP